MQHKGTMAYPALAALAGLALIILTGCAAPLNEAARSGDISSMEQLAAKGHDVNAGSGSETPLHAAAKAGQADAIRFLISKGAVADSYDGLNDTPLNWATWYGHIEASQALLDGGANINYMSNHNWSPLNCAANMNKPQMVEYLLQKGADPNLRTNQGKTALDIAREKGYMDIVAILSRPEYSGSPDAIAARKREAEAIRIEREKSERAQRDFDAAKASNTVEAYESFISKYPDSAFRTEAVKALAGRILMLPDSGRALEDATAKYPDMIVFLPSALRLRFIGPPGMQVYKVVSLLEKGIGEKLIVTKIRAEKGGYKNFDLDEILKLKQMGIPESVIDEMIAATGRAETVSENAALKEEIARLRKSIEDMQARQAQTPTYAPGQPVPASAQAPQAPGVAETIANCAARLAALELCGQAPGGFIGQEICKAAAKSQFPCNQ